MINIDCDGGEWKGYLLYKQNPIGLLGEVVTRDTKSGSRMAGYSIYYTSKISDETKYSGLKFFCLWFINMKAFIYGSAHCTKPILCNRSLIHKILPVSSLSFYQIQGKKYHLQYQYPQQFNIELTCLIRGVTRGWAKQEPSMYLCRNGISGSCLWNSFLVKYAVFQYYQ